MSDAKPATVTPIPPAAVPAIPRRSSSPIPTLIQSRSVLCFVLTTIMPSAHNAGLFPLDAMILAMAVFYGGAAQIVAAIFDWRKANTFATTAFISYGDFLLNSCRDHRLFEAGSGRETSCTAKAPWLGIWGLMSFTMFIGTLSA